MPDTTTPRFSQALFAKISIRKRREVTDCRWNCVVFQMVNQEISCVFYPISL